MKEIKKWVLDFVKIKNFCSAKDTVKRMKKKQVNGRKYLPFTYQRNNLYPKYTKNS